MAKGLPLITMAVGSLMSFLALFALSSAFMVSVNPNPSSNKREVSYHIHQRRSSCSHLQAKKKKKGPASDALAQLEALEALEVLEVEGQSGVALMCLCERLLSLLVALSPGALSSCTTVMMIPVETFNSTHSHPPPRISSSETYL